MDPAKQIKEFLDRVRKRSSWYQFQHNLFLLLVWLVSGGLIGNLIAYFSSEPRAFLWPFLGLWIVGLIVLLISLFRRGQFSSLRQDQAALLVEEKIEGLDNNLINSIQLEPQLHQEKAATGHSRAFIRELVDRTQRQIQGVDPGSLVSQKNLVFSRKLLVGVLGGVLVLGLFLPDFWTRGYTNWVTPPVQAQAPLQINGTEDPSPVVQPEPDYQVEHLQLVFNYPAYTRLKTVMQNPAEGKINVLPGTEVGLKARLNHIVSGASLVLNDKDHLAMNVTDTGELEGKMMARVSGHYQFEVKTPQGNKILLPTKYPITLGKDEAPQITIFLANPKPVYFMTDKVQFYYEGHDDFGIRKIDLVINVEGKARRKTIKSVKGFEKDLKDGYTWELSTLDLNPGQEVHYFLEIFDNDSIFGPNTGQSEVFSFEIFDEQKKRLDLLALQDQLIDRMVGLLAHGLVSNEREYKNTPEDLNRLKHTLAYNTDQLIEIITIAQSIESEAKTIQSFPKPYLTLLNNIITGLNDVREDQIEVMNQISNAIVKATPIGYNFPPVGPVNDKLITHLERDILFLLRIMNRERMNQVMDMEQSLHDLAESLREEFDKAREKDMKLNAPQFKSMVQKLKETLQKIMEQLAKQNQALPDEFLNRNAFESLNMESFNASLEKLMDLVNQGKMDEAMNELEKLTDDMRAFGEQLRDMQESQDNLVDMEMMKKLDDSMEKIDSLEERQKDLLGKTTDMNKKLRAQQSEKFEDRIKKLFESLRKDVNAIQALLQQDQGALADHPKMKKMIDLMDKQAEASEKIKTMNQKTLDSVGQKGLRSQFKDLNEIRERLSGIVQEIHNLRMKMFHGYSNFLPQIREKYDKLEELTELMDLYDFNSLFQKTYPEILRWQNHFRSARDLDRELHDQMKNDLFAINHLNREISKKLGTLMRDLKKDYQSLIGQQDKSQMQNMAEDQQKLRNEAQDLSEMFQEMNQQNPLISPQLSNNMNGTGRFMKQAERNLQQFQIPDSIESENNALQKLAQTKDMLNQLKNAQNSPGQSGRQKMFQFGRGQARDNRRGSGSTRMKQEQVNLPTEDQYQAPGRFREDILKAMKNRYPQKYERLIGEYYKELVK